jgi:hypothetical protein
MEICLHTYLYISGKVGTKQKRRRRRRRRRRIECGMYIEKDMKCVSGERGGTHANTSDPKVQFWPFSVKRV